MRAWIETRAKGWWGKQLMVARRVRAWIETQNQILNRKNLQSHAVCVRGLKQDAVAVINDDEGRTPCACVD